MRVVLVADSSMIPMRQKSGELVAYHVDPSMELDKYAPKECRSWDGNSLKMTTNSLSIAIGGGTSPDVMKGVERATPSHHFGGTELPPLGGPPATPLSPAGPQPPLRRRLKSNVDRKPPRCGASAHAMGGSRAQRPTL